MCKKINRSKLVGVSFPLLVSEELPGRNAQSCAASEVIFLVQATLHQKGLVVPNCISPDVVEVRNLSNLEITLDTTYSLALCSPIQEGCVQPLDRLLKTFYRKLEKAEADEDPGAAVNVANVNITLILLHDFSEAERQLGSKAAEKLRKLCLDNSDLFTDGAGVSATSLFEAPIEITKGVVVCKPRY